MKKIRFLLSTFICICILGVTFSYGGTFGNSSRTFRLDSVDQTQDGKIILQGKTSLDLIKVKVEYNSNTYYQDLYIKDGIYQDTLWFTEGPGTYDVTFLLSKGQNTYTKGPEIEFFNPLAPSEIDTTGMFTNPEKDIASDDPRIIELAKEITIDCQTDIEKAKAIYTWISLNTQYDYDKYWDIKNNKSGYELGSLTALNHKKGICYDLSALYAALARSLSIETKLIKGNSYNREFSGYHAWNEVYLNNSSQWIKLDVTYGITELEKNFNPADFDTNHSKQQEM